MRHLQIGHSRKEVLMKCSTFELVKILLAKINPLKVYATETAYHLKKLAESFRCFAYNSCKDMFPESYFQLKYEFLWS